MAHIRETIVAGIAALLSDNPTTWKLVFESRMPVARDVLDYLLVFIDSEICELATVARYPDLDRDMAIHIVAYTRIPQNHVGLEAKIDDLLAELETALSEEALVDEINIAGIQQFHLSSIRTDIEVDDNQRSYAVTETVWRLQCTTPHGDPSLLV